MDKFDVREIDGIVYKVNRRTGELYQWVDGELDGLGGFWSKIKKTVKKSVKGKIAPLAKTAAAGVITYYGGGALVKTPLGQKLLGPKKPGEKSAPKSVPQFDLSPQYMQTPQYTSAEMQAAYRPPSSSEDGMKKIMLMGGVALGSVALLAFALKKK